MKTHAYSTVGRQGNPFLKILRSEIRVTEIAKETMTRLRSKECSWAFVQQRKSATVGLLIVPWTFFSWKQGPPTSFYRENKARQWVFIEKTRPANEFLSIHFFSGWQDKYCKTRAIRHHSSLQCTVRYSPAQRVYLPCPKMTPSHEGA